MFCCTNCFVDTEIKSVIDSNKTIGNCDFCGSQEASVYEIGKFGIIEDYFDGLIDIYTPESLLPADFPKEKVGLIKDILCKKWNIFTLKPNKIYDLIKAMCSEKYNNRPEIFDKPVGVRQFRDTEYLEDNSILKNNSWDDFVEEIKTGNRFHSNCISIDKLFTFLGYAAKPHKAGEIFYRARICPDVKGFKPSEMGAPPSEKASGGRVNPSGISTLYLSDSKETTVREIRAGQYDFVTIASFKLLRDINVIDLAHIDKISPFTNINYTQYAINIEHLKRIAEEISKPIRNHNTLDYIPTQYISDYIKSKGYDGIEYVSVMSDTGKNLAVFNPQLAKCTRRRVYDVESISYELRLSH